MRDWDTLNAEVIAEYRANNGKVSRFGDKPVIILHTIGARSGQLREIPLIPVLRGDDLLLYGTAAGSPTHPAWYYNLRAHPHITVEYDGETFTADLTQLSDDEAELVLSEHAESEPLLVQYLAAAAPRVIPVFRLTRA